MRVNTVGSIKTANSVHNRFGSWKAAKASSDFKDGKFVVRTSSGRLVPVTTSSKPGAQKA